jgi:hypothetical protein
MIGTTTTGGGTSFFGVTISSFLIFSVVVTARGATTFLVATVFGCSVVCFTVSILFF